VYLAAVRAKFALIVVGNVTSLETAYSSKIKYYESIVFYCMLFYAKTKKVMINPKPDIIEKMVLFFSFALALAVVHEKRGADALLLRMYELEDDFDLPLLVWENNEQDDLADVLGAYGNDPNE
jgi:hypothetical protein